jgi:predicted RNase H-like nuclease (RuvC/YqgF family)
MKKAILLSLVVSLVLPLTIGSETIYTWKDKDGVMRFSNGSPPEDVKEYKIVESTPASSNAMEPDDRHRSSYDQMVKQASKEADASRAKRKRQAAEKAADRARALEEKRIERIKAEREQLEAQIEAIKRRAVSPTFPNGMKQAQIDALNKKIEALEKGLKTQRTKN